MNPAATDRVPFGRAQLAALLHLRPVLPAIVS